MLQKLRENSTGWVAKLILLLLTVPFLFFGMEQYLTQRVDTWVAQIEAPPTWWENAPSWWPVSMLWTTETIQTDEFRNQFQQVRQRQQQAQGDAFDPRTFETVENKRLVLERMVDDRVQKMMAVRSDVVVSDAVVRETIQGFPAFQVDGKFNAQSYQLGLASQVPPRSPRQFEQLIRESLQQSLVSEQVAASAFVTDAQFKRTMALLAERRDLAYLILPRPVLAPDSAEMAVSDEQIEQWYAQHKSEYRAPETVTLEYVEVDASKLAVAEADEAALKQRYEQEKARFVEADQRLVSHILVKVADGADAAAVEAAKAEAAKLAVQARQPGADFAELARKNSDDVGSSASGGDLGWITPDTMAAPFDAAVFAMQPGAISDPVKTDFGWHVIQLREVKAGDQVPFEQVRQELAQEYKAVASERAYNELAGKLLDEVYKNPNALAPAAQAVGLSVQTAAPIARGGGNGILANPAVQRAAFSETLIEDGTVSDPIEIGPGHSVLIRVLEHVAQRARPLDEVRDQVIAAIRDDRIDQQALAAAKRMVSELEAGATLQSLAEARGLAIVEVPNLPRGAPVPDAASADAVFALAPPAEGKVAAAQTMMADDSRVVFVVSKVTPGNVDEIPPQELATMEQQLIRIAGDQDASTLVEAVRQRMQVKVAEDRL